MSSDRPVFARADTLLGICEAIGQDFGFNPIFLRLAFGVSLLWNPLASLAVYGALGIAVMASRLLFPPRKSIVVVSTSAIAGDNDDHAVPSAIAA